MRAFYETGWWQILFPFVMMIAGVILGQVVNERRAERRPSPPAPSPPRPATQPAPTAPPAAGIQLQDILRDRQQIRANAPPTGSGSDRWTAGDIAVVLGLIGAIGAYLYGRTIVELVVLGTAALGLGYTIGTFRSFRQRGLIAPDWRAFQAAAVICFGLGLLVFVVLREPLTEPSNYESLLRKLERGHVASILDAPDGAFFAVLVGFGIAVTALSLYRLLRLGVGLYLEVRDRITPLPIGPRSWFLSRERAKAYDPWGEIGWISAGLIAALVLVSGVAFGLYIELVGH